LRRITLSAAAAAALLPAAAPADAHAACRAADARPATTSVETIRAATVCLINAERRERGLRPLRRNRGLRLAGQRHVRDMVRRRYFAHDSRSGRGFETRIVRTGYLGGGGGMLGENLAWGEGRLATPRQIVRAWMRSPGHRRNMLSRRFREVGIGVTRRAPQGDRGATYAAEFGRRY
jgi:uncharacterized protein YkwD